MTSAFPCTLQRRPPEGAAAGRRDRRVCGRWPLRRRQRPQRGARGPRPGPCPLSSTQPPCLFASSPEVPLPTNPGSLESFPQPAFFVSSPERECRSLACLDGGLMVWQNTGEFKFAPSKSTALSMSSRKFCAHNTNNYPAQICFAHFPPSKFVPNVYLDRVLPLDGWTEKSFLR